MLLTGEAPRRFSQKPITSLSGPAAEQPWAQAISEVLERATRTNPARRFQTVDEFWDAFRRALRTKGPDGDGADGGQADFHKARHRYTDTPAARPPAPEFARAVEPSKVPRSSHRIVVPVGAPPPPPPARRDPKVQTRPEPPAPRQRYVEDELEATPLRRKPGRIRGLLVALVLLLTFGAMLYATHTYVSSLRRSPARPAPSASSQDTPVGREFVTNTDVNLRSGPSRSSEVVGVAERASVLRVKEVNGSWYNVEVVQRGRPKADPASADQGWAHNSLLKAR